MPRVKAPIVPDPVNQDWVRQNLLAYETVCEAPLCTLQAQGAHFGLKYVVYLCEFHIAIAEHNKHIARSFERNMWTWFNDMFNFIVLVESTHGELLSQIEALESRERDAEKLDDRNASLAEREFNKALAKHHRELKQQIKVGAPDDGLMEVRGAQSPQRATQPVLRITEPTLVTPVILPQSRADKIIFVIPLQGRNK